jgi:chorismate dehydratase
MVLGILNYGIFAQGTCMNTIRISAVSYLNTLPFVYGILESGMLENVRLSLDVPSVCAAKLKSGEADIALVPSGAIPDFTSAQYVSDYCIGAVNRVRTVLLLSRVPLDAIRSVYLDFDSRTSVVLVKLLARHFWNISPQWIELHPGEAETVPGLETVVAIGDKTFSMAGDFPFVYDLAEEWIRFTSLPFVFAVWMTTRDLPASLFASFNNALAFGVSRKKESLEFFRDRLPSCDDCLGYLEKNISYPFDGEKRKGLELFLEMIKRK